MNNVNILFLFIRDIYRSQVAKKKERERERGIERERMEFRTIDYEKEYDIGRLSIMTIGDNMIFPLNE